MAQPNAAAMALDAADGRIDGKFFGGQITQHGNAASAKVATPVAVSRSAVVPYTGVAQTNNVVGGYGVGGYGYGVGMGNFMTGYAPAFNAATVTGSPFIGAYGGRTLATVGSTAIPVTNIATNIAPVANVGTFGVSPVSTMQTVPMTTGFVAPTTTALAVNTVPSVGLGYGNMLNTGIGYNTNIVPTATLSRGLVGNIGSIATPVLGGAIGGNMIGGNMLGAVGNSFLTTTPVVNTVNTTPVMNVNTFGINSMPGTVIRSAYTPAYTGMFNSNAGAKLALDAADGRIDGSFFGAPIVG